MMSTTMTTATMTASLLQHGSDSAEFIVKGWIRKVFRETSLQILRQQWKDQHMDDDAVNATSASSTTSSLEITESMLQKCHQVCGRLAVRWEKQLQEGGQVQVATWVKDVAAGGQFWLVKEPQSDIGETPDAAATKTGDYSENNGNQEEAVTPTTDEAGTTEAPPVDDDAVSSSSGDDDAPFSDTKVPLAKLRKLYKSNRTLADWNTTLDKLGRSGQTQWPQQDWHLIEEYCRTELVDRLHTTKRGKQVQFEVVPKELVSSNGNDEQQQQEEDTAIQSVRIQEILDRKRKEQADPSGTRRVVRQRALTQTTNDASEARDPSDHPELVVWDWEAEKKTIVDKSKLESDFLHSEQESAPPNSILGALRPTGHTYFHQSGFDVFSTDKQRRRALKASIKQRISKAEVLRDERKTPNTKVLRTKMNSSDGSGAAYFMELDVGECLLNLDGKLHAFSCLEVSLKDEDDA